MLREVETRAHILREDILGLLWRIEERNQVGIQTDELPQLLGTSQHALRKALRRLLKQGTIQKTNTDWKLTEAGRSRATSLIRSHRLWEAYLDKHYPQDSHQLHHAAELLEHVTTREMQSALGSADVDPHGSPVPEDSENE